MASRAIEQFCNLAHHALLMLLGLRAGRVGVEHNIRRLVRVRARVVPALHRGLHELRHLGDERRILELALQHPQAVLRRADALVVILEHHERLGL